MHLYLGPQRRQFSVHKKLLCHQSPFFAKAFDGGFEETVHGKMTLEEDDSYAFEIFLYWLYRGHLPPAKPIGDRGRNLAFSHGLLSITGGLAKFYLLADKYLLNDDVREEILNKVLEIRKLGQSFSDPKIITFLCHNTEDDDPPRRMVMDLACADYVKGNDFMKQVEQDSENFDFVAFLKAFKDYENFSRCGRGPYYSTEPFEPTMDNKSSSTAKERYQGGFRKRRKTSHQKGHATAKGS